MHEPQPVSVKIVEATAEGVLGTVLGNSMGQIAQAGLAIAHAIRDFTVVFAKAHNVEIATPSPRRSLVFGG